MRRNLIARWALWLVLAWVVPTPAHAAQPDEEPPWYAGKLDTIIGVDYRSGDYGRELDTDILFVPLSIRYRFQEIGFTDRDEVRLRLSIPYLQVEGPERGSASSPDVAGTDRGIGDLSLRGTYVYVPKPRWLPTVYLSGRVKFPTASESKNLGTGEFDFTTDLLLRKRFRLRNVSFLRSVKPFVGVGYKIVGEPPGEDRDNSFRATAGTTLDISRHLDLGLRYTFRESSIPGRGDFHLLSPYLGYRVSSWLRLTPYAVFGLSERSPDWGVGLAIRFTKAIR